MASPNKKRWPTEDKNPSKPARKERKGGATKSRMKLVHQKHEPPDNGKKSAHGTLDSGEGPRERKKAEDIGENSY